MFLSLNLFKNKINKLKYFKILVFIWCLSLYSCGGGSNNALPPKASLDIEEPYIESTMPSSEQPDVKANSFIEVKFNEDIVDVTRNNVSIFPLDDFNEPMLGSAILLDLNLPFEFDIDSKTLTIISKQNEFKT